MMGREAAEIARLKLELEDWKQAARDYRHYAQAALKLASDNGVQLTEALLETVKLAASPSDSDPKE